MQIRRLDALVQEEEQGESFVPILLCLVESGELTEAAELDRSGT